MIPLYDVFKIEMDGSLHWCEAASTLEGAKARVDELAMSSAPQYVILSQKTGSTMVVTPGQARGTAHRKKPRRRENP